MAASTMHYRGRAAQENTWVTDQPAKDVVYAFENVGSISIGDKERPLLSSQEGATYVCFANDNTQKLCFSSAEVMDFVRDPNIQVVFAGYWYKKGWIRRYDDNGFETQEYKNFRKKLTSTETILMKAFEANANAKTTPERVEVPVPVPTIDWWMTLRVAAYSAVAAYILALVSAIVISMVR